MTKKEYTSMRISVETRALLEEAKEHKRETLEDVIVRLLRND